MSVTAEQCRLLAADLVRETGAKLQLECNKWPDVVSFYALDGLVESGILVVRVGNEERRYLAGADALYPERSLHFPNGYEDYRMQGCEKFVVTTPGGEVWHAHSATELDALRERAWSLHDAEGQ